MPKSPTGDNVPLLRSRWKTPKRQRLLEKVIGQRCFIDFGKVEDEAEADPTLIKDLRGANLASRDLHDVLLMNADIRWADFTEARVQGTFQHITLSHANFDRAVLTGCRFWKAKAIACHFERAALMRVSFEEANLFEASFRAAQLTETRFEGVDLRGADFAGARLQGCVLKRVKLDESTREFWAQFSEAQCRLEEVQWSEEALAEA